MTSFIARDQLRLLHGAPLPAQEMPRLDVHSARERGVDVAVSLGGRGRGFALRGLHLLVLSAFAVAQPLFDLLGRTPEFFVVRGSTSLDIVVFALVLVLLLPALCLASEALVALASRRAADVLHLLFVAAFVGLIALQGAKRVDALHAWIAVGLAAAVGAAAAFLYARRATVRLVLTVLSPAPLVFLALFLSNSPLDQLGLETDAHAETKPAVQADAPVVLLVFDELPIASLMNERGRIDAGRYPNFAALAGDSTWFRNASTVHEHTTEAVPAILTGKKPEHGRLPLVAHHPDNLFTFLGGEYAMHVFEPVTQLCPPNLCPRDRDDFGGRMSALGHDVSLIYLHAVLPSGLTGGLPSVTETWMDFGREHGAEETGANLALRDEADIDRTVGRQLWADQRTRFETYAESIERPREPTFYFMHAMLPHSPWRFLPSGRQYTESLGIDGIAKDVWGDDEWLVTQGWQRHLLQVGFTDRLLGTMLERLRETGIYDRAVVVAVADHGVSFIPGERRRGVTPATIGDIAPVPLFVKLPGQKRAAVVDRHVRTLDVAPTIADVLGTPLPYPHEGRSLFDEANDRDEVAVMERSGEVVSVSADEVARMRDATVERMTATLGSGSWASLHTIGERAALVGRALDGVPHEAFEGVAATVDNATLLTDLDPASTLSPTHVSGRLEGDEAAAGIDVAVSVNGTIAAVTRAFGGEGEVKFRAFVPEEVFRRGENDVQIHLILSDGALAPVGGTGDSTGFVLASDGRSIETPRGTTLRVRPGALTGFVEDWFVERETVRFGGWAGDVQARKPATNVLVFADGELVYSGTPSVGRADLGERHPGLGRSGFVVELRRDLVGEGGDARLQFFAVRDGVASELEYAKGFPWTPLP